MWPWRPRQPLNAIRSLEVRRSPANPLFTPESSPLLGTNLSGPSLIRVPSWIEQPLGTYYLYIGNHHGRAIHLAYADDLEGPWRVHDRPVLQSEQSIAAPDVHVDTERGEIRMYFRISGSSAVATSSDGLAFVPRGGIVSKSYLRVFRWNDAFYGICKDGNSGWGMLLRSVDGMTPFEPRGRFIRRMRHAAVLLRDRRLVVFYSRVGDRPERIVVATVDLSDSWDHWRDSEPLDVLRPEEPYEGIAFPNARSRYGAAVQVRQLRDPFVFDDGGRLFLFYSTAGESGLAMAELSLEIAPV
jgi:hypothetical protein